VLLGVPEWFISRCRWNRERARRKRTKQLYRLGRTAGLRPFAGRRGDRPRNSSVALGAALSKKRAAFDKLRLLVRRRSTERRLLLTSSKVSCGMGTLGRRRATQSKRTGSGKATPG